MKNFFVYSLCGINRLFIHVGLGNLIKFVKYGNVYSYFEGESFQIFVNFLRSRVACLNFGKVCKIIVQNLFAKLRMTA